MQRQKLPKIVCYNPKKKEGIAYRRKIDGYAYTPTMSAFNYTDIIQGDDKIASWHGYPQRLRSDNGPELISKKLETWAKAHDDVLDFIEPGKTAQNAYIERFNRTYREEVLSLYLFSSLTEIREITEQWPKE